MFDEIDFKTKCPRCSSEVDTFQSKDGPCMMELLWPHDVSTFYSQCDSCHAWVTCEYIPPACGKIVVEALVDDRERCVGKYETSWNPDDYPKNHPKKLPGA